MLCIPLPSSIGQWLCLTSLAKKSREDLRNNLLEMYMLLLESTQTGGRVILGKYIPFANTWRLYHESKPAVKTVFI